MSPPELTEAFRKWVDESRGAYIISKSEMYYPVGSYLMVPFSEFQLGKIAKGGEAILEHPSLPIHVINTNGVYIRCSMFRSWMGADPTQVVHENFPLFRSLELYRPTSDSCKDERFGPLKHLLDTGIESNPYSHIMH